MNYTIYRIKSPKYKGYLFLKYKDGVLTNAEMPERVDDAHISLPIKEHMLKVASSTIGIDNVQEIPARTAKEKIIMFCHWYKHERGTSYVAKDHERANIKHVPLTKELLRVFFGSPLHNFTIDNYISRINITKDWAKNGMPDKTRGGHKHPNHWDAEYEKKLDSTQLMEYRQHLVSLGWQKVEHAIRGTYFIKKIYNN